MTLDEFLASVRADTVPPTYVPDGSGYWSNGLPCATCGSISVVLDPTPACVVCTKRVDDMYVNCELLLRALDDLLHDVRFLPPQAQRTLAVSALIANVQLQKLLGALS